MNKHKATFYTAAKHADVSIATVTVSRIVASGPKVAPGTRQRVMQAIEDLNFGPKPSSRHELLELGWSAILWVPGPIETRSLRTPGRGEQDITFSKKRAFSQFV